MPRRTGSAFLALALAALPGAARAAAELRAELDRDEISLQETAELVVRLVSDEAPAEVQLPASEAAYRVIPGGQSQQTQVTMGGAGLQFKHVRQYRLVIEPLRAGTLEIPGPVVVVGREKLTHPPLRLRVTDAPPKQRPGRQGPGEEEEDEPLPGRPGSLSWKGWERDLALRVRLDKKEAFVGEQVTAALEVVSPVPVVGLDAYRPPALDGFWSEDLRARQGERIERIGGVPMRVVLLRKLALFPARPGTVTIEPFELELRVQIASRDPLGLFPEVRQARRRSKALALRVKPLPPGAPPGFQPGNVGEWTLSREVAEASPAAGQPFAVKVTARGSGNLRGLALPPVPVLPGLRTFDPGLSDDPQPRGDRFGGSRTLETLVAVDRPGPFTLPALEWPTFDPATGRYQVARLPAVSLDVGPAAAVSRAPVADVAALASELRPLRTDGALGPRGAPAWRSPLFAAAVAAPPALVVALALWLRARGALAAGEGERRRRRAGREAKRRLREARRRMERGDEAGFHDEVARALHAYAGDRLGEPVAGLTRDGLLDRLARAGALGPGAALLARALEACDAGRFGGAARMPELLALAEEAISQLEETEWHPRGAAP
ncbi:MAG: protein BatD [Deltaproteobacteria bacterium]|nr:protein BatD [Deltaproteobacteria bacterium]